VIPANVAATASAIGLRFPSAPTSLTGWGWGTIYREI
jgi:hypothetical protein